SPRCKSSAVQQTARFDLGSPQWKKNVDLAADALHEFLTAVLAQTDFHEAIELIFQVTEENALVDLLMLHELIEKDKQVPPRLVEVADLLSVFLRIGIGRHSIEIVESRSERCIFFTQLIAV